VLACAEWLQGFPPRITLAGPIPDGERVLIDAIAAPVDSQGAYEIPGYDSAGDHTIWCAGVSRSYLISRAPQSWEPWRAHDGRKGSVCGALSDYQVSNPQARLTTVPCSNNVLIGAEPGQVYAGSGQGGEWTGIVPFAPVWALPANPFQCRKNAARIMLRAPIPVARAGASRFKSLTVKAWCRAILDCQRKGLTLESPMALHSGMVMSARRALRGGAFASMGPNELLLLLSARKSGSWYQFRSCVDEVMAEEVPDAAGLPLHQIIRLNLSRMGHVEFDGSEDSDDWRAAPPVLAVVKTPAGFRECSAAQDHWIRWKDFTRRLPRCR